MPNCHICGKKVTSLPQHVTDMHSTPGDMVIFGEVHHFTRDPDDNALVCPLRDCTNRHERRSNFLRHLKEHGLDPTTPRSNGKRSLSSSLENLSIRARKKTKIAMAKFEKAVDSAYFAFSVVASLNSPSQKSNLA
jgi:hypothetical protein